MFVILERECGADIETMLDLMMKLECIRSKEKESQENKEKKKPGRPKKEPAINEEQRKIGGFLKGK